MSLTALSHFEIVELINAVVRSIVVYPQYLRARQSVISVPLFNHLVDFQYVSRYKFCFNCIDNI